MWGASSPALPLSLWALLPETSLKPPTRHQPRPSAPPGSGPAAAGVPLGSLGCGSLACITTPQLSHDVGRPVMLRVTVPPWERLQVGREGRTSWRRERARLGSAPVRGVSTSPGGSARHQGAPRSAQGPAAGRALLSLTPAPGPQEPRLLWRDPQARDMPLGPDVTCESDLHRAPFNRAIN